MCVYCTFNFRGPLRSTILVHLPQDVELGLCQVFVVCVTSCRLFRHFHPTRTIVTLDVYRLLFYLRIGL